MTTNATTTTSAQTQYFFSLPLHIYNSSSSRNNNKNNNNASNHNLGVGENDDGRSEPFLSGEDNKANHWFRSFCGVRDPTEEHDANHSDSTTTPAANANTNANTSTSTTSCWSALSQWFVKSAWPGMGLFGESYVLFSIGTLKPIWEILYPTCFDGTTCPPRLLHSLTYSVVVGVITGMVVVGALANSIGRRRGSILTATLMSVGALGLTLAAQGLTNYPIALYRTMSVLLFIFGVGVGGEYPLSASSASEKAMEELKEQQILEEWEQACAEARAQQQQPTPLNQESQPATVPNAIPPSTPITPPPPTTTTSTIDYRGRNVQLVFTMQGLGIWFNSLTLMVLLVITGQTNVDKGYQRYDDDALISIWRITYGLGAIFLFVVQMSRIMFLGESKVWEDDQRQRDRLPRNRDMICLINVCRVDPKSQIIDHEWPQKLSSSISSLSNPTVVAEPHEAQQVMQSPASADPEADRVSPPITLLLRNYGCRLFGASMSWLLWDIAFYGNKLFQSSFLLALTGDGTTLFQIMTAAFLNSSVALLGYFGAALIVDHPNVGRVRLQSLGFFLTGCLFVGCGFLFDKLSSTGLVAMYLGSSFFGQLGPNCTTFLIPAEIFPTQMRTLCHGIAAASGKLGALIAAIMFNYVTDDVDMFLFSGYASFAACAITFWTIPETTGLDLHEIDRKWRLTLDGRIADYKGDANKPMYLSYHERRSFGLEY